MDISPVLEYFQAERITCAAFIVLGILSLILTLYLFWTAGEPFYRGLAWSFLLMASVEISVCGVVFLRTPDDTDRVARQIKHEREKIQTEEIPRMERVIADLGVYRWIQAAVTLAGIMLFFLSPADSLWRGLGLGLFLHAALLLVNDYFAAERAREYLEYLRHIG